MYNGIESQETNLYEIVTVVVISGWGHYEDK